MGLLPQTADLEAFSGDFHPLLKKLLFLRGLNSEEEIEKFLNPNYEEHLHDPFLLNDIEKAAKRIISAIENKEKILIYSDYDADGIPGGVILHDFLTDAGHQNFENYIPHRHNEGFGLHLEAVESFAEKGVNLIITVDCGTADAEQISKAQSLGMDVIITDHHEISGELPNAFAIVNPKRSDSTYPFPMLCGAAVAFKLVQATLKTGNFGWPEGKEKWLLDMAGIATLSDMVPLVGENRVLAHYGLKVLRKSRRPGLTKMLQKLRINQRNLSEDDIAFMITPRINAASRMGNAEDAFRLLATRDFAEADAVARELDRINNARKGIVASIVKEAKHKASELDSSLRAIVLGNPDWRPAMLGLVANNLVEEFGKPVFLWGRDGEDVLKGSCRSDGRINILSVMEEAKDHFLEFGGHKAAGGFAVIFDKIHTLQERICSACDVICGSENFEQEKISIDERLNIEDVNRVTFNEINRLAPFGVGNSKPIFLLENVEISSVKEFGKQGKHFEVKFVGTPVKAIYFFTPKEKLEVLNEGNRVNLIASLEESFFLGRPELRLRIVDVFK